MAHEETLDPTAGAPQRSTGSLKAGTGSLEAASAAPANSERIGVAVRRDLSTRIA
jgi:hypothetical protein